MKRCVIICRRFCPGEAWTNRILGYAKGFSELGLNVSLLFIISDKARTSYPIDIPNVEVNYLWENDGFLARSCRLLSYIKNKRRIKQFITDGDICFISDASGFYLKEIKAAKKDIKIVYESTEHPEVIFHSLGKCHISRFLNKLHNVDLIFVIYCYIFIIKKFFARNINMFS